jgi:tol-pal system protein YbgF
MKNWITYAVIILAAASWVYAQTPKSESNVGIGFDVGLQKLYSDKPGYVLHDVSHTAYAPAGEFLLKFIITNQFNFALGLGYGYVGDGFFDKSSYETSMVGGDLRLNLQPFSFRTFNPFLTLGFGMFSYQYNPTINYSKDYAETFLGGTKGKRLNAGAVIFGGGVEIMTSPQFSVNLTADYRHTTTDYLDGGSYHGKSKDGFFNGRIGIVYYMNKRNYKSTSSDEDLLALDKANAGQVGGSTANKYGENLSTFEAKLDKMEASESNYSMEQYNRLKSRYDELNHLIDGKEKEIDDLKLTLELKDQRIMDIESELNSAGSKGDNNFARNYETALETYYSKNYSAALSQFQSLKDRFPNNKLSSNCQYWIGECYFGMGEYQKALEAFKSVLSYSFSYKKDDATLMMARCYMKLNDRVNAKTYFQQLLNSYPDSEYIEKAKEWLSRLG